MSPVQQGSPLSPHGVQVALSQIRPASQMSGAQHGSPLAPQGTHVWLSQTRSASQALPAQQGSVSAPHVTQIALSQTSPLPQIEPAQHASPRPPQSGVSWQLPVRQVRPLQQARSPDGQDPAVGMQTGALPAQAPSWHKPVQHCASVPHFVPSGRQAQRRCGPFLGVANPEQHRRQLRRSRPR